MSQPHILPFLIHRTDCGSRRRVWCCFHIPCLSRIDRVCSALSEYAVFNITVFCSWSTIFGRSVYRHSWIFRGFFLRYRRETAKEKQSESHWKAMTITINTPVISSWTSLHNAVSFAHANSLYWTKPWTKEWHMNCTLDESWGNESRIQLIPHNFWYHRTSLSNGWNFCFCGMFRVRVSARTPAVSIGNLSCFVSGTAMTIHSEGALPPFLHLF
jgi:hypothetical protein